MATKAAAKRQASPDVERLAIQYGCGPVQFSGTDEALYERHLLFDSGVDLAVATARDRFEALARSVRDVLSQRWLLTEKTYEERNPKRLYYLSMEYLLGRSLENNVTNLLLSPLAKQVIEDKKLNLVEILENLARFFASESCGKCVPCRLGTVRFEQLLGALRNGTATERELEEGVSLARLLQETSICALGQVAGKAFLDAMTHFPEEMRAHLRGECPARALVPAEAP